MGRLGTDVWSLACIAGGAVVAGAATFGLLEARQREAAGMGEAPCATMVSVSSDVAVSVGGSDVGMRHGRRHPGHVRAEVRRGGPGACVRMVTVHEAPKVRFEAVDVEGLAEVRAQAEAMRAQAEAVRMEAHRSRQQVEEARRRVEAEMRRIDVERRRMARELNRR